MVVIGAKGLAKEIIEILKELNELENLYFFDNLPQNKETAVYNRFPVLKTMEMLEKEIARDPRFTIAIGNPAVRENFYLELNALGGDFTSTISLGAKIGSFDVEIGAGCNIMNNASIANGCAIGKGVLVYHNVQITHDCTVGDFSTLAPGAVLLGGSKIGRATQIGANATILPNISVGDNVVIGAGAVVVKDVPDNMVYAGVPAKKLHGGE